MRHFISKIAFLAVIFTISSCAFLQKETAPIDYLNGGSKLDIQKFFDGPVDGFAIKQDGAGKIVDSYSLHVKGQWDGNKGVIKQNFYYRNGKQDSRTWLVTLNKDGTFNAVGHDVANSAKGKQVANAAQSVYSLMISDQGQKKEVLFEERMYLVDEKSMIMITSFKDKGSLYSKGGESGKVITSLKKLPELKKEKKNLPPKPPAPGAEDFDDLDDDF